MARRFVIFAILGAAAFACQEPDPNYGDPNGIWGKLLPGEKASASSGGAVDVAAPTTTLKAEHGNDAGKAGGAPAVGAAGNCAACHVGSPGKKFAYGGRVEDNGAGVADIVVSVDGLDSVKTDADGYFWLLSDKDVAKDSKTRVQKGDQTTAMSSVLGAGTAGGGCLAVGTCHGGTQGPIHP